MTEEQLREEFLAKRFIQAYKLTDEFAKQSCKIALNYIKKMDIPMILSNIKEIEKKDIFFEIV